MIRGTLYAESDSLEGVDLRYLHSCTDKDGKPYPYLNLDLGRTNLTLYLAPEDLPRIAGMLRLAAENIEALIGAPDEKAKPILHLVQKPLASDAVASAA